jgi:pyruvate dehydrogenase E2 component (dihydrolipoamide acetyltransferase)
MPYTLCMPKLSPTMTEGTIAKWHTPVGTHVNAGELILEVATDKATIEHHLPDPGWLRQVLVKEGEKARVGQPLAILTTGEKDSIAGYTPEAIAVEEEAPATPTPVAVAPLPVPALETQRIPASPLARTIAAKESIPLKGVRGTGPGGRIMSRDLELLRHRRTPETPMFLPPAGASLTPLSQIRQVIGKRLQYSQATIPHFYVTSIIEVSELVSYREGLKAQGSTVTINDLILKATATALMAHPSMRCSLFSDQLLQHEHADIAVAVSLPGGLITPIIFHAETKSLQDISKESRSLGEKAKAGKLQPNEYTGGAFTLTNLGMFGVDEFIAIINPPQVAILAIGAASDAPVVKNGSVVPGKLIHLTVSADHRAVDGSDAAGFLKTMKDLLHSPKALG